MLLFHFILLVYFFIFIFFFFFALLAKSLNKSTSERVYFEGYFLLQKTTKIIKEIEFIFSLFNPFVPGFYFLSNFEI